MTGAQRRIGEISAQLGKAKPGVKPKGELHPPRGSNKADALKAAGLTIQTASRWRDQGGVTKPSGKFPEGPKGGRSGRQLITAAHPAFSSRAAPRKYLCPPHMHKHSTDVSAA
jgi:hypothetical protein